MTDLLIIGGGAAGLMAAGVIFSLRRQRYELFI